MPTRKVSTGWRLIKVPSTVRGEAAKCLRKGQWHDIDLLVHIQSLGLGGAYLHVGAEFGNHAIYLALYSASEKVVAIEKDFAGAYTCGIFADENGLSSEVEVVHMMAGDAEGSKEIEYLLSEGFTEKARVRVARLDDVVDGSISLLLINEPGREVDVLRGSSELIGRDRPRVFIALDEGHDGQAIEHMASLHYERTRAEVIDKKWHEFICARHQAAVNNRTDSVG